MQTTDKLLMIRPLYFGSNPDTLESNAFQERSSAVNIERLRQLAMDEFDSMVRALQEVGIHPWVVEDDELCSSPDAVFPNNWLTTHVSGLIITYPMLAQSRRCERRQDIVRTLLARHGFQKHMSLSAFETEGRFLEGTGSLVLDRVNKKAYCCLSPRSDRAVLDAFCALTGYESLVFKALDSQGKTVYHTNVLMSIGDRYAVICSESIADPVERKLVTQSLLDTGRKLIEITQSQMKAFAGNMLEVRNDQGGAYVLMSRTAFKSLNRNQVQQLSTCAELLCLDIPTIEQYGGGSVRCMICELFMPQRANG